MYIPNTWLGREKPPMSARVSRQNARALNCSPYETMSIGVWNTTWKYSNTTYVCPLRSTPRGCSPRERARAFSTRARCASARAPTATPMTARPIAAFFFLLSSFRESTPQTKKKGAGAGALRRGAALRAVDALVRERRRAHAAALQPAPIPRFKSTHAGAQREKTSLPRVMREREREGKKRARERERERRRFLK